MTAFPAGTITRNPNHITLCVQPVIARGPRPLFPSGIVLTSIRKVITIGRSRHNTIKLLDESISVIHAAVFYEQECWYLMDLNSTNGTQVLGRAGHFIAPITSDGRRIPLKRGDTILIAGFLEIPIV